MRQGKPTPFSAPTNVFTYETTVRDFQNGPSVFTKTFPTIVRFKPIYLHNKPGSLCCYLNISRWHDKEWSIIPVALTSTSMASKFNVEITVEAFDNTKWMKSMERVISIDDLDEKSQGMRFPDSQIIPYKGNGVDLFKLKVKLHIAPSVVTESLHLMNLLSGMTDGKFVIN